MAAVAIDGPSGAGKSTIARLASTALGYLYVDTGALYRAIAYYVTRAGADTSRPETVIPLLGEIRLELRFVEGVQRVFLNGEDVSDKIRGPEISLHTAKVSAVPQVRELLLELQRSMAAKGNVIMDGRDIGTVVLPGADVKIFLTASPEERARRRCREYEQKGEAADYQAVLAQVIERDYADSHRAIAPLRQAEDAVLVDTTGKTLEESVELVLAEIRRQLSL